MARRSKKDWIAALKDFVKDLRIQSKEISSTEAGGSPFDLWLSQEMFLEELADALANGIHKIFTLKARQLGLTTISLAIDIFWLAMHPGMVGALVTDTEQNSEKNRFQIESYINSLPYDYFGQWAMYKGEPSFISKSNRKFILFANGSRLDLKNAGTKNKGVSWAEGEGYTFAHCTELGKYGDGEALKSFEASFAQENEHRLYLYESTANGPNHWKEMCEAARKDIHQSKMIFLGWWANPTNAIQRRDPRYKDWCHAPDAEERELMEAVAALYGHKVSMEQLAWYRYKYDKEATDGGIFGQNYPWTEHQAFIQMGHSFFPTRKIGATLKAIKENPDDYNYHGYRYSFGNRFFDMQMHWLHPDESSEDEIELRVWEEPKPDGRYVIGCDPAWGRNEHKDNTAISVWRCYADKLVQVAEYASSSVDPKQAAWILAHMAGAYQDCILNVEVTGGSGSVIMMEMDALRLQLYSELYQSVVKEKQWEDALGQARWYMYRRPDSPGKGYILNFETTWKTKPQIMEQMKSSFYCEQLGIRSTGLLREMSLVVRDGNQIEAPESSDPECKDDRVFSAALAIRAWLDHRMPEMLGLGLTYSVVSQQESGQSTMQSKSINGIVARFFATEKQKAELDDINYGALTWKAQRGLA